MIPAGTVLRHKLVPTTIVLSCDGLPLDGECFCGAVVAEMQETYDLGVVHNDFIIKNFEILEDI